MAEATLSQLVTPRSSVHKQCLSLFSLFIYGEAPTVHLFLLQLCLSMLHCALKMFSVKEFYACHCLTHLSVGSSVCHIKMLRIPLPNLDKATDISAISKYNAMLCEVCMLVAVTITVPLRLPENVWSEREITYCGAITSSILSFTLSTTAVTFWWVSGYLYSFSWISCKWQLEYAVETWITAWRERNMTYAMYIILRLNVCLVD